MKKWSFFFVELGWKVLNAAEQKAAKEKLQWSLVQIAGLVNNSLDY